MAQVQQLAITAEKTRFIKQDRFAPSSSLTAEPNKDTVYLAYMLEFFGSIQTTYASGAPVADDTSIMARLINFIKIDAGGDNILKNINPWFFHMQSLIAKGQFSNRFCEAGAAPIPVDDVDADAKFVFGTTGQYTSFNEAVLIPFEFIMAGEGRKNTWLDARGLPSLTVEFTTAGFNNVMEFGNAAPVVYANDQIYYRLTSIETQNVPLNVKFFTWKQSQKTVSASAGGTKREDIVRGNYLASIALLVRGGDSNKSLSNSALKELALIINGDRYPKQTNFQVLQKTNREKYGLNVPFLNGSSVMDGYAYLDLLVPLGDASLGTLDTAQNMLSPAVDTAQLELTYDANGTYANEATVTMQFNEIIKPV